MISYEKLEVYQLSLDFIELSLPLLKGLPRGYAELSSQLKRRSLNVATFMVGKNCYFGKSHLR